MKQPYYEFSVDSETFRFEFLSIGKAIIRKAVIFQPLRIKDYYNLAMGDVVDAEDIDVYSRSNNGDMKKVLSTVVQIALYFLERKPEASIYIEGSTQARIRIYQIAIESELENFEEHFVISGFKGDDFEPFRRNANYSALVISLGKR